MTYVFLGGGECGGGGEGGGGVPAGIASGYGLCGDVLSAFGEFLCKDGGGDGGKSGDATLYVVPVVIGAVMCAWGGGGGVSGRRGRGEGG